MPTSVMPSENTRGSSLGCCGSAFDIKRLRSQPATIQPQKKITTTCTNSRDKLMWNVVRTRLSNTTSADISNTPKTSSGGTASATPRPTASAGRPLFSRETSFHSTSPKTSVKVPNDV